MYRPRQLPSLLRPKYAADRSHDQGSRSSERTDLFLKKGPTECPGTSENNYGRSFCNKPEEQIPLLHLPKTDGLFSTLFIG